MWIWLRAYWSRHYQGGAVSHRPHDRVWIGMGGCPAPVMERSHYQRRANAAIAWGDATNNSPACSKARSSVSAAWQIRTFETSEHGCCGAEVLHYKRKDRIFRLRVHECPSIDGRG